MSQNRRCLIITGVNVMKVIWKFWKFWKKYFEKYHDSRFHEALIDLHVRNDENYDHQYFDESLQTLIDLENCLIYKQINLE